jgi:hypothetical protein
VDRDFGGEIALLGYELSAPSIRPGATVRLTLYWQALSRPTRNYTVFTHLLDPTERLVGQMDGQPDRGRAPTLGWVPGQVITDSYELTLASGVAGNRVALEVGLYDAESGARLPLAGNAGDRLILETLPVSGGP